jgi:hypothetical protein
VTESFVYVYAVLGQPLDVKFKGIDARPVRFLTQGTLAAAVSDVPADEFDQEPLNERVRDMGWLGPRAIAHQDVNARLHESAEAMIPLAFGTVFRDDDRVRHLLQDQAPALTERLEAVRGCTEWVVALHLLKEPDVADVAAASSAIQDVQREIEASSKKPGRAHLLRRRLAELERDEARRLQGEAADEVLAGLQDIAADVFSEPLPSDTVERPLLRASVLVARQDEAQFLGAIEQLRARWPEPTYRLLLTGPWPAYRFGGIKADHA